MSDKMTVGRISPNELDKTPVQPVKLKRQVKINSIHDHSVNANIPVKMAYMQLPNFLNGSATQNTNTASYT